MSSSAATKSTWQLVQRQWLLRFLSARKLSMTQEQIGQIRIQFISKRPSAAACRKRSIASASARPLSAANFIGLMRRSSASLAERMWLSSLETSRGLQVRADSSAVRRSSRSFSSIAAMAVPPDCTTVRRTSSLVVHMSNFPGSNAVYHSERRKVTGRNGARSPVWHVVSLCERIRGQARFVGNSAVYG